ncbi:MAG TPA: protein phosphatase 2C domain-containing protein [Nostocaceae cyanobacterium]|nr:protein phosphatase 2C domain-containing protein [Nostocaceae cyanobacterium]
MENDAATLYCPNESCQAANSLTDNFCQRCGTPLPKRYLWAVGEGLNLGSPGAILADRYLVIGKSIILDIKPGLLPQIPELEHTQPVRPYLKLIAYRVHLPQVYGVLSLGEGQSRQEILLLEKGPVTVNQKTSQIQLCSELTSVWADASSIRQIHWLWQIANLWQPLSTEGVASSLLSADLLRVEGTLVRLLELRFDQIKPTFAQLGEFWQQLVQDAQPVVKEFIQKISLGLIQGEISSSEQLITVLDQGLTELGRSQSTSVKIYARTDTGPCRQRNEDACFPRNNVLLNKPPQHNVLAIVCDGIGGHEGGNVASNLAIETIHQQVVELTSVSPEYLDSSLILSDLEQAVAVVNDKISQRNDSENRQGRQRMGTTLVMALPIAHELYITHVGDSRAYWITPYGCYQVTLDDDVASREVRLGYAIYREAVAQSGAGSLVQALGMSKSTSLHPTAQRFIIDEDAVFLLTSDGLSDFDRVEENWEAEILPIIAGERDITQAAERLVEIANTKNGHDNVTIALVHYQVKYSEPEIALKAEIPAFTAPKTVNLTPKTLPSSPVNNSPQKTKVIPETKFSGFPLPLSLLAPFTVIVLAGSLGYLWKMQNWSAPTASPTQSASPQPQIKTTAIDPKNLPKDLVIQTTKSVSFNKQEPLAPGSFLQVLETKVNSQTVGDVKVHLRVCGSGKAVKSFWTDLSKLQNSDVEVWPPDQPSTCNQPPTTQAPPTSENINNNPN